jgi:hypothetical protein
VHTYGIPDDEVVASIIDVFVVLNEIAQGEIVLVRHIVARIARRGDVERAHRGVLSRAEIVTRGETAGVAAYRVGEKGPRSSVCCTTHSGGRDVQFTPGFMDSIADVFTLPCASIAAQLTLLCLGTRGGEVSKG